MKLVLIESSGKKETVEKYLGKGYKVIATKGHVRDLPVKKLGVDIEHNFKPDYVIMSDKKKLIEYLKSEASKAETVLFATDPDREGEAIAWHLETVLGVDPKDKSRIVFNEISKNAVQKALTQPRAVDINLVDAQQARRVLDRLVGYKLSPYVCNKIQSKLSAGRVQSVTLRLVVERDREIENFEPKEYWTLVGLFDVDKTDVKEKIKATLNLPKKQTINSKEEMDKILADLDGANYKITNVKRAESKSHPSAPFTTSTMQQDALSKLGLSLKQTSSIAQLLYEGIEIPGEGKVALITYIRTDSVRVSKEAQAEAIDFIKNKYGDKYAPSTPNIYKSKKNIQDAHEAIRPITLSRTPDSIKNIKDKNCYRLYKLIYERFLASQMAEAKYNSMTVDIEGAGYNFKATGRTLLFDGFTAVYNNATEEDEASQDKLPNVEEGDKLTLIEFKPEQKYTKPPARFTEASLVKMMEEKGIGRPATYSPTVNLLLSRDYIEKESKALKSTELGRSVVDLLVKNFDDVMDVAFTAQMENKLDEIEEGGKIWQDVIRDFYTGFEKELKEALKDNTKVERHYEESDEVCEKCGAKMIIKTGKYGKFLACPNFPECKNIRSINNIVGKCPKCGSDVAQRRTKKGKIFYGCTNYPKCDYASWDIPFPEKCPDCGADMVVKHYASYDHIKCTKCEYTRKDKKAKKKENEE